MLPNTLLASQSQPMFFRPKIVQTDWCLIILSNFDYTLLCRALSQPSQGFAYEGRQTGEVGRMTHKVRGGKIKVATSFGEAHLFEGTREIHYCLGMSGDTREDLCNQA